MEVLKSRCRGAKRRPAVSCIAWLDLKLDSTESGVIDMLPDNEIPPLLVFAQEIHDRCAAGLRVLNPHIVGGVWNGHSVRFRKQTT